MAGILAYARPSLGGSGGSQAFIASRRSKAVTALPRTAVFHASSDFCGGHEVGTLPKVKAGGASKNGVSAIPNGVSAREAKKTIRALSMREYLLAQ